jgi:hypothetical protein
MAAGLRLSVRELFDFRRPAKTSGHQKGASLPEVGKPDLSIHILSTILAAPFAPMVD